MASSSSAAPSIWDELSSARREMDRVFDRFFSFTLPRTVDADGIKARFEDGILTVTLPKAENAKPRRVQIEANGKAR